MDRGWMIRVVALKKAVAAGVGGAIAMEIVARAGRLIGLQTIDMIAELSAVAFRGSRLLADSAAVAAHLGIGICWATFYAFFFWGRLRLRPILQGLLFALIPALLAILVVYPELTPTLIRSRVPRARKNGCWTSPLGLAA